MEADGRGEEGVKGEGVLRGEGAEWVGEGGGREWFYQWVEFFDQDAPH